MSSPFPTIYEFILTMCTCAETTMANERYAPADYTVSFDDDSSLCEEPNRGLEIFRSRPVESDSERFSPIKRRLGFGLGSECDSSPPISPSPSFGTATTVSMDFSMTSTRSTEVASHHNHTTNHNSGNSTPCNSITIRKLHCVEEDDRESSIRSLTLASPVSEELESKSTQELYYQVASSSLYPTLEEKDELNRRFKLQQQRCQTATPILVQ